MIKIINEEIRCIKDKCKVVWNGKNNIPKIRKIGNNKVFIINASTGFPRPWIINALLSLINKNGIERMNKESSILKSIPENKNWFNWEIPKINAIEIKKESQIWIFVVYSIKFFISSILFLMKYWDIY